MTAIKDTTPPFTLTYNGITFGPLIKSEIDARPIPDRAHRVFTHIEYTLTVHGFIFSDTVSAQNATMDDLQDRLTEKGGKLTIEDMGFDSDISTHINGSRPDLLWGAEPEIIHFEPLGHVTAEVVWVVKFNVSRCASSGRLRQLPFMAFNFAATYTTDLEGLTTRTIDGYCQTPALRGENSTALLFNVDALWDKITCAVPRNFRRVANTRRINEAKNQIDFAFTDEQLPGDPFPAGIVNADLDYNFENTVSRSFIQWMGSLSGSITVAPGESNTLAGQVFFAILLAKVREMRKAAREQIHPIKLRVGHKLFSRTSSFSCAFIVNTCIKDILGASGIWSPIPGSNYQQWATSMRNVWDNRGTAGLKFNPKDDKLVTACVQFPNASIGNDTERRQFVSTSKRLPALTFSVTKENSYLSYSNVVQGVTEENAVIHRYAAKYTPGVSTSSGQPHEIQYQGSPDFYVLMHGVAHRLKFKPDLPELLNVAGVKAELLSENIEDVDTPLLNLFDAPIYKLKWSRLYRLARRPTSAKLTLKKDSPEPCQ